MRPSLTKSKSDIHLSLSLPSPLPRPPVSFSNNKLLPASFGPSPWAVSCFLDAWWTPVTRLSPALFFFLSFFFLLKIGALLSLCCGDSSFSSPVSLWVVALPSCARYRSRDTCGLLVWSLKRRDLDTVLCCHGDPSFSEPGPCPVTGFMDKYTGVCVDGVVHVCVYHYILAWCLAAHWDVSIAAFSYIRTAE